MSRYIPSIVLIILLCGSSISAQSPQGAEKWEYKIIYLNEIFGTPRPSPFTKTDSFTEGLNNYGRDGWQLVAIDAFKGGEIAIFKRTLAK